MESASSSSQAGIISVLISPEQKEKEGKLCLFLFLWICNKASRCKSFNLRRNESWISVFWLQRTISLPLFFCQTATETESALLIESRRSASPLVFVYLWVKVNKSRRAESLENSLNFLSNTPEGFWQIWDFFF